MALFCDSCDFQVAIPSDVRLHFSVLLLSLPTISCCSLVSTAGSDESSASCNTVRIVLSPHSPDVGANTLQVLSLRLSPVRSAAERAHQRMRKRSLNHQGRLLILPLSSSLSTERRERGSMKTHLLFSASYPGNEPFPIGMSLTYVG